MNHSSRYSSKSINMMRRRLMQGVGAIAATSVAAPVFSSDLVEHSFIGITGNVLSKIDSPIKTVILKNHTNQPVEIDQFHNGVLVFDGEFLDCNGSCLDTSLRLNSGEESLIQFDKRGLFKSQNRSIGTLNVQSAVQRLCDGTRVIPIQGSVNNRVLTLAIQTDHIVS